MASVIKATRVIPNGFGMRENLQRIRNHKPKPNHATVQKKRAMQVVEYLALGLSQGRGRTIGLSSKRIREAVVEKLRQRGWAVKETRTGFEATEKGQNPVEIKWVELNLDDHFR